MTGREGEGRGGGTASIVSLALEYTRQVILKLMRPFLQLLHTSVTLWRSRSSPSPLNRQRHKKPVDLNSDKSQAELAEPLRHFSGRLKDQFPYMLKPASVSILV